MFDLCPIKRVLGKRSLPPLPSEDNISPFDSPLPYYSTIPKMKWQDSRFLQLGRTERGDFGLLVDFLWQGCATIRRSDISYIAEQMGVTDHELNTLVDRLLELGLLVEQQGRLVQPELRIQYRETFRANQNKGGTTRTRAGENQEW